MDGTQFLCALGGCLWGAAVAGLKYLLTRKIESRPPSGFMLASLIRQAFNLSALALAGLLCWFTDLPMLAVLIGTAAGATLPTIVIAVVQRLRRNPDGPNHAPED